MADERQYNETVDPKNPPNSVLQPRARSSALGVFLGGILVFFLIAAVAWVYWDSTDKRRASPDEKAATEQTETSEVGTAGEKADEEEPGRGGFNPDPKPDDTKDELEFRGVPEK